MAQWGYATYGRERDSLATPWLGAALWVVWKSSCEPVTTSTELSRLEMATVSTEMATEAAAISVLLLAALILMMCCSGLYGKALSQP